MVAGSSYARSHRAGAVLGLVLFLIGISAAVANRGDLDPSFGTGGRVFIEPSGPSSSEVRTQSHRSETVGCCLPGTVDTASLRSFDLRMTVDPNRRSAIRVSLLSPAPSAVRRRLSWNFAME